MFLRLFSFIHLMIHGKKTPAGCLKLMLQRFLILFLHISANAVQGQDLKLTIRVLGSAREPVPSANISIRERGDSVYIEKKLADSSGVAHFQLFSSKQYLISVSAISFVTTEKKISTAKQDLSMTITLEPAGKVLDPVVVKTQKPLMRQEGDKTIVDPESIVAISTTGYEVIERTPGLFVDQDGNIYISSLTPAAVQVNGRELKMSAADIAGFLKSLPPDAISRIEIVRTPSAKYEASGSGGLVNVVLKKGFKPGMTGSFNGGFQQGSYGNQFIGFSLNQNDGKKSSSLNINYNRRNGLETLHSSRLFAIDSLLSQDSRTFYPSQSWYAGYQYNFPSTGRWELEAESSLSLNEHRNQSNNNNEIEKISTQQVLTENLNSVKNKGNSVNLRGGFEAKYKLDSSGSEWENDLSFGYTDNKATQVFHSEYLQPTAIITAGDGDYRNRRSSFVLESDLTLQKKARLKVETGFRSGFLFFQNKAEYYKEQPAGNRQPDPGRTNTFHYHENIHAFYLQVSKTLGKDFILKTGARLENTNMSAVQKIPDDTSFQLHRTDLFPYLYLSKKIMTIAGYELRAYLVYRRSIRRPVYEQLNPFPRYVDQYLTEAGNPSLRPQFNQNYEANISVDEKPLFAVGLNDTRDIFTSVLYQPDGNRYQALRTFDNLGRNKEWYFRGLGALPPGGKYFFVLGAQYNHNFYKGLYENKPLSFKKGTWTFFTLHSLKLDSRSSISLNGFWRLKGQQQLYELEPFGMLNSSINRKFFKNKLVITASINDIFYSSPNEFRIRQGTVDAQGIRRSDTRRAGLNIRYHFGVRKKEENNNIFDTDFTEEK